jgi:conjugal transfer pilus assembly protein TraW
VIRKENGVITDRVEGTNNPLYIVNRRRSDNRTQGDFIAHPKAGDTVAVSEEDLIKVMQKKMATTDWEKTKAEAEQRHWAKKAYLSLPPAKHTATRRFSPSFRIDADFEVSGSVILPKGTVLNPFDAAPIITKYLVFNPLRLVEVEYAKSVMESRTSADKWMLIATEFPRSETMAQVMSLQNTIGGAIYLLNQTVKDRFSLVATPSKIIPNAELKLFEITELAL